jgi:hypothetical protein
VSTETEDRAAPTEPRDYAELNAIWLSLLVAAVLAGRQGAREPLSSSEMAQISAAAFALSKAITREKIGSWVREPFVEEQAHGERRPRGRRLRAAVGEMLSCTRCVGTWSAVGIVGLRFAHPPTGRVVTAVLATSAANDWMQAGFRWLCAQSNVADEAPGHVDVTGARPTSLATGGLVGPPPGNHGSGGRGPAASTTEKGWESQ